MLLIIILYTENVHIGMSTYKVDVVLNVYGKPYQTYVALKSLLKVSGELIDKIFFIQEIEQPHNDTFDIIFNDIELLEKIELYIPKYYFYINEHKPKLYKKEDYRLSLRYQYGFEKSNKRFVFITHNDVLYKADIIKYFLDNIGENMGVGEIGQCWNCPFNFAKICNRYNYAEHSQSYKEVKDIFKKYKPIRPYKLNRRNVFPLPECRLNEWFCLLNRELYIDKSYPNGKNLFGTHRGTDTAVEWFREMNLSKMKFKHLNTEDYATHAYFSEEKSGHRALLNDEKYFDQEEKAKKYMKNFLDAFTK